MLRYTVSDPGQIGRVFREIIDTLQNAFGRDALRSKVFATALDQWGTRVLDPEVQRNLAGRILKRRTGNLAARTRVTNAVTRRRGPRAVEATIGITTLDPPGFIHEYGGTIRPRRRQWLTVPLPAALTAAGVLRDTAAELRRAGAPTFVFRSRRGNLLIARRISDERIEPLFVLKRQVQMPARQWASKAVTATLPKLGPFLERAIEQAFPRR